MPEYEISPNSLLLNYLYFIIFWKIMNKIYLLCIISALLATTAIVVKIAENKKTEVKPVGPFVPTNEWQEVLPGQAVPKVF